MEAELAAIRDGLVAAADRDDPDGRYRRGDAVGFVGDELVAWGGAGSTLAETSSAGSREGAEIVTVIEGAEAPLRAGRARARARRRGRARDPRRRPAQLLVADRRPVSR